MAPTISKDPPTFDSNTAEDAALEKLGYEPELKRSFGLIGMVGFSFSIVTCWSALSGVLIIGVLSGGPPVMIFSWIGVCLFGLPVAYSMAEMCSAYPVAGGQYSWSYVLAPQSMKRGLSYVTGWFMLIGIIAMGATNNEITANFILAMAVVNNPSFVIERWHTVLVSWAVGIFALAVNIYLPRLLDRISRGLLIWNICSFLIIVITILATNDHKQSASFVFSDFINLTGFSSASFASVIGLSQAGFGLCCYDAPAHMTEEIVDARKQAPRAIIMSVYIGAFTGLIFLISACFCIGDIDATAASATGVPIVEIFLNSTASNAGASCLTVLLTVIGLGASNGLTAEGGRAVYAFARDRGLPFSDLWSKVEKKKAIPVAGLCLTVLVQLALNAIYFGNSTGFLTVVTFATLGFYVSYALPLLSRLLSIVVGDPAAQPGGLGGLYSLGRFSIPLNLIALVFLLFMSITYNFPTIAPVNSENMNYTAAAVGVVMGIAGVTWVTTGGRQFRGPESGGVDVDRGGIIEGKEEEAGADAEVSAGPDEKKGQL